MAEPIIDDLPHGITLTDDERSVYERLRADHLGAPSTMDMVLVDLAKATVEMELARKRLLEHIDTDQDAKTKKYQLAYDRARMHATRCRRLLQRKGAEGGRHISKKDELANEARNMAEDDLYGEPDSNVVPLPKKRRRKNGSA